jgi:hypothetical protein
MKKKIKSLLHGVFPPYLWIPQVKEISFANETLTNVSSVGSGRAIPIYTRQHWKTPRS